MKIDIDLNDVTYAYLHDLANEHKVSPDDIVEGLLIGYGLSGLNDQKPHQNQRKDILPAFKHPMDLSKARKNIDYIVIPELSDEIQQDFTNWIKGRSRPIIFQEKDNFCNCAFYSDYLEFMDNLL